MTTSCSSRSCPPAGALSVPGADHPTGCTGKPSLDYRFVSGTIIEGTATGKSRPMLLVQEANLADGGNDLPRDQAAAGDLVRGHPPDRDGEERHLIGGTRPSSRGQAADGLDHEAEDHGGDGSARGREAAVGRNGRRLSRRGALGRQAGPWRGRQDALCGGGFDQSRGPAAQREAGAGQGFPQARDRARRQALADSGSGGCDGRPRLLERARRGRVQPSDDPHRLGSNGGPAWRRSNG